MSALAAVAGSDDAERQAFLVFQSAASWFAVDAPAVEEILALEQPTPLPRMPPHVPGLVFQHGHAVPLLDLAAFLDLAPAAAAEAPARATEEPLPQRVLVVLADGMKVGLLCPRVRGVLETEKERLAPPEALGDAVRRFSTAQIVHPDGVIAVLDLAALLGAARPRPVTA